MKKLTLEYCKEIALKEGYEIRESKYINVSTPMKFFHLACQRESKKIWSSFSSGHGCKYCFFEKNGINARWKIEDCKKESLKRGYILLEDEYLNSFTKMKFFHSKCGNYFSLMWNTFYCSKRGCPICSRKAGWEKLKFTMEFCKKFAKEEGYRINDEKYLNSNEYLNFIHLGCGTNFQMIWKNFYAGHRCPECMGSESPTARELKKYYKHKLNAIPEYRVVRNPKTNYLLPYDIFIEKHNPDGRDIFIEVQGKQHYKFTKHYHKTMKNFTEQRYRDNIKKKYARKNGIYIEIDLREKVSIKKIIKKINLAIAQYG